MNRHIVDMTYMKVFFQQQKSGIITLFRDMSLFGEGGYKTFCAPPQDRVKLFSVPLLKGGNFTPLCSAPPPPPRDWSLIKGRGGLQNGRGRACEVLSLRKGGA